MIYDFQIVSLAANHYGNGNFEVEVPRDGSCVKVRFLWLHSVVSARQVFSLYLCLSRMTVAVPFLFVPFSRLYRLILPRGRNCHTAQAYFDNSSIRMNDGSSCFASAHTISQELLCIPSCPAQAEFLSVYQQQLKDMIIGQVDKKGPARDRPLEGLKVVVNAGNGMGGFLVDTLAEVQ